MKHYLFMLICCLGLSSFAQDYFPDSKGVKAKTSNYVAITNAIIHVSPSKTLENSSLLFKDGKVVSLGDSKFPKNTVIISAKGKHIYPSFIELYSGFGINDLPKAPRTSQPQYNPNRSGYYWNDHVRPDQSATAHFKFDEKKAEAMRKAGFGTVNTHVTDAFVRGTSALYTLKNGENLNENLLKSNSAQYFAFDKSQQSRQAYPSSIMGFTALLRQFYHDTEAYKNGLISEKDMAIEAFIKNENLPQIFEVSDYLNALRADKIGDQFGVQYTIIGSGDEYKRVQTIKETKARFVLPVDYPNAYDVEDSYLRDYLSLSDMKHWQQAPNNAMMLADNGVEIAFTTKDLKSPNTLHKNLAKSVKLGLDKATALAALTTVPAQILQVSNQLGTLDEGKIANFIITSNELFAKDTKILENWVQGHRFTYGDINQIDISGDYLLTFDNAEYDLSISPKGTSFKATLKNSTNTFNTKLSFENNWLNLIIPVEAQDEPQFHVLSAKIDKQTNQINGKAVLANGTESRFTATKKTSAESDSSKDKNDSKKDHQENNHDILPVTYPNMAYGLSTPNPESKRILFKNATIITGSQQGKLEGYDLLVQDGKIEKIGKDLKSRRSEVIDATGKFLTAGIIDEHSHIAASSVNEGGHNSSAEVKMEDAVNPDDISIYRSLAGGVTTIQLLHGSANPIGGRSAILKLKWGKPAEEMIYDNSPKFIKFALGENVKQSNWGGNSRFPQSRMGVEQVFIDYFTRAKEYGELKASGEPYRVDEELETLLEIINSERFISCHSYVQSEINMLMKVADQFDFNVNTFTHILEGYKVADKMKAHGAGGSTFSDWWAYKYEVNDAIPFNAAIMHEQGVTVVINSDDGEMIRRLNQEAAKSMKYGDVSAEDAWKFVTANPAKLLHIEDRVGTVEEGKDADLVLWNAHPLSIYAKPEKTMIEGVVYFDLEKDLAMRKQIKKERNVLINQMMQAKNKGLKTQPIKKKEKEFLHCDSLDHLNHKHN